MSEIIAPVVNLNGTAWGDLLEQHMAVAQHLTAALDAMEEAAPHRRDFPIEGTFAVAKKQFRKRHQALRGILRDYTVLAVAISDQERKR